MSSAGESDQPVGEALPGWSRRPRPTAGPFPGRFCHVVPLGAEHADALYDTCAGPEHEALWRYLTVGPFLGRAAFAGHVARTVEDPASVAVAVCDPSGVPVGTGCFLRIDEDNGSVEVGSIVLGRALRRSTAATEAMHLMAGHVFDDLGYRRYEWKCDALNAASRRAALRLGFGYEGTFRQAMVYKGRNRDTAWFSLLDHEWPQVAARHRAWLDPANFRADGTQRRSLQMAGPTSRLSGC